MGETLECVFHDLVTICFEKGEDEWGAERCEAEEKETYSRIRRYRRRAARLRIVVGLRR